jgi:hypothetical protein
MYILNLFCFRLPISATVQESHPLSPVTNPTGDLKSVSLLIDRLDLAVNGFADSWACEI